MRVQTFVSGKKNSYEMNYFTAISTAMKEIENQINECIILGYNVNSVCHSITTIPLLHRENPEDQNMFIVTAIVTFD